MRGRNHLDKNNVGESYVPCNAKEVVYWENKDGKANIVRPNGEVVRADLEGEEGEETGIGYISHFATCPNANSHRRR